MEAWIQKKEGHKKRVLRPSFSSTVTRSLAKVTRVLVVVRRLLNLSEGQVTADARFVGERLICDPQPVSWWPPAPWPPRRPRKWRRTGESTDTAAAVDLCGNQTLTARSC